MSPSTAFNFKNIITTKGVGMYNLKGNAYYMFTPKYLKQVAKMYEYDEDDIKALMAIDVEFDIDFTEFSMYMKYVMKANVYNEEADKDYLVKVTCEYTEKKQIFERYKPIITPNGNTGSGGAPAQDKFSKATFKMVGQELEFNSNKPIYYTSLKEGTYVLEYIHDDMLMNSLNNMYVTANYTLYDGSKNKLSNVYIQNEYQNINYEKFIFIIDKPTTYYIECQSSERMNFKLTKLEYSQTFRDDNIVEYDTNVEGKTEGMFDFKKYTIYSEKAGIVRIKNTGEKFSILTTTDNSEYTAQKYVVNDYLDRLIQNGENVFYVCSDKVNLYEDQNYSFEVELLFDYDFKELYEEYEKLPILTDNKPDKMYYLSNLLGPIKFTFEVLESGEYVIRGADKSYYNSELVNVNTHETIEGTIVADDIVFNLEPGEYAINFAPLSTQNDMYVTIQPYYIKK